MRLSRRGFFGMKMTGAQIIMECLMREGVELVFGIPGGSTLPFYDAFRHYPQIRHILVKHEQAAAHAADAYARVTGKAGVCCATSGPGATNLVTGIANAWMDSVPMVAITGQVVTWLIGRDGFQEADTTGITLPITKANWLVLQADDLARTVKEAFYIARTGRPGPVLIDVPRDVFIQEAEFEYPDTVDLPGFKPTLDGHPAQIKKAAQVIAESERPLILAGHGVKISQAFEELRELAEKAQIPVITTLLGIGGFPGSHPLCMGMPGMHGMYWNNMAINEADLLIAIGMRFDDRVTGALKEFAPHARVIHIDIDPAEIGKNVKPTVPIVGDVKRVLAALNAQVTEKRHDEWIAWIRKMREEHPSIAIPDNEELLPQYVVKKIYELSGRQGYVVTGVGQHQMWAAQYFWNDKPNSFVTAGGLGPMGFEVPAAMGVQFAHPKELVWAICGDGGFQMTMQELAAIVEYELPIKFAILNNSFLGMVRQWQEMFYANRVFATREFGPDYVRLAEAFGLVGLRVTDRKQVEGAIEQALRHPGPVLIDFEVKPDECVFPMVPPGASLSQTIDQPPVQTKAPRRREEVTATR
jgi:acetolactate synthase-1/2/3 large subunit